MKAGNGRRAEWASFESRLSEVLRGLDEGHTLTVQTRDEEPYFVQFSPDGDGGMLVEAVSNRLLHGWRRLDRTAEGRLRRLGWRPPTDIGDGPQCWWRSYPAPFSTGSVAAVAVATLAKPFDVPRVAELTYQACSSAGAEILFPTLGLARSSDGPSLRERVDRALQEFLGVDELIRTPAGDTPIRSGEAMVYVRVRADRNFVGVFSPVLLDITRTPALVDAVNQVNNDIRVARAAVTDQDVIFAAEVEDAPGAEGSVINAIEAVSSLANSYGEELQSRFGGRTFFQEPAAPPDQHTGLYL